jgi:hypothetical protein
MVGHLMLKQYHASAGTNHGNEKSPRCWQRDVTCVVPTRREMNHWRERQEPRGLVGEEVVMGQGLMSHRPNMFHRGQRWCKYRQRNP